MMLSMLSAHKFAQPFLDPVDPVALGIPDYKTIVREPMDLGTVKKKLKGKEYKNPAQMLVDIRKIWANSFLYNPVSSAMHSMTGEMNEYFQKIQKDLFDNIQEDIFPSGNQKLAKEKSRENIEEIKNKSPPSKNFERAMTYEEKRSLTEMIKSNPLLIRSQS